MLAKRFAPLAIVARYTTLWTAVIGIDSPALAGNPPSFGKCIQIGDNKLVLVF